MKDNIKAYNILHNRGVTRLCHFTKVKSLVHILTSEDGILATDFINDDVKKPNDTQRLDKATDHVCCSIQYPNSWFWRNAKKRDSDTIFREWAVLVVDLGILKVKEFKFCPCNAAKNSGSLIRNDVNNIEMLFASPISGRYRSAKMLKCCPTDDQAEILIYKNIPLSYINGIIVGNNDCANNISAILKTINLILPIYISSSVCCTQWSNQVRVGQIPMEIEYKYRGE